MNSRAAASVVASLSLALAVAACSSPEPSGDTTTATTSSGGGSSEGAASTGATHAGGAGKGATSEGGHAKGDGSKGGGHEPLPTNPGADGDDPGDAPVDEGDAAAGGAPIPDVDLREVSEALNSDGWTDCSPKPIVDTAGYQKITCIVPDRLAVPGQDGNAVAVMKFGKWSQANDYAYEWGSKHTRLMNGYIVDGATEKAVQGAVDAIERG